MSSAASLKPETLGGVFRCLGILFAEMIGRVVADLVAWRGSLPRWHPLRMVISAEVAALRALGRRVETYLATAADELDAEDAAAAAARAAAVVARPRLVFVRRDGGAVPVAPHPTNVFPRPLYPPKWGCRSGFAASLTALEAA